MGSEGPHWQRRTARRRVLGGAGLLGAGAAGLALVGCGDDSKSTSGTSSSTATGSTVPPKRGGVANIPLGPAIDTLDPHAAPVSGGFFWSFIGNNAISLVKDFKIVGELVTGWEIPGDGTEFVFKIRPGVKWHNTPPTNGRAFTSDDLAFSLLRMAGNLDPKQLASFPRTAYLPNVVKAGTPDASTVTLTLSKPNGGIFYGLTDPRMTILPRDFVEQGTKFDDGTKLVGSGPFICTRHELGVKTTFKVNPTYWDTGKPYLDGVTWVYSSDSATTVSLLAQGNVDLASYGGPSLADRNTVKLLAKDARPVAWNGGSTGFFGFNCARPPFSDQRVRQALALSINYQQIGDAYYGANNWQITGPVSASWPQGFSAAEVGKFEGYDPATKPAAITKAKALLSAAGFPTGALSFTYVTPSSGFGNESGIRVQDSLKSIWPDMKMAIDIAADAATFTKRQTAGDFDMFPQQTAPTPDVVLELATHYHSKGGRNYSKLLDPTTDALIDKANTQTDAAARQITVKDIQTRLFETRPRAWLYDQIDVVYLQPKVRGMDVIGVPGGGGVPYRTYRTMTGMSFDA